MIFVDRKYKKPEIGDAKKVKRFAFFPKRINGNIVFLGFYEELFLFTEIPYNHGKGTILARMWVKISEKTL